MKEEDVLKLITLYESILHGDVENMGLFNCYDTYYAGCWDEDLKKVESLKDKLGINQLTNPKK